MNSVTIPANDSTIADTANNLRWEVYWLNTRTTTVAVHPAANEPPDSGATDVRLTNAVQNYTVRFRLGNGTKVYTCTADKYYVRMRTPTFPLVISVVEVTQ